MVTAENESTMETGTYKIDKALIKPVPVCIIESENQMNYTQAERVCYKD